MIANGLFGHGSGIEATSFDLLLLASSALVRMMQAFVESAPYLVVGAVAAGVLRNLVGSGGLRRVFGSGWSCLPLAWALGASLPLCSLSVLPVVHQLRRAGASSGPLICFMLSAAMFNPLSLVYGLTLFEPALLVLLLTSGLVVSVAMGCLWNGHVAAVPEPTEPPRLSGLHRLAGCGLTATSAWFGPVAFDLLVGLAGVGIVAALLSPGALQTAMRRDNLWATPMSAVVALPIYMTPLKGMMQAGTLLRDGFCPAACWSLLVIGIGANLGTFSWLGREFGWRRSLGMLATLLGLVLLVGYAMNIVVPARTPADHTHALDEHTQPTALRSSPITPSAFIVLVRERTGTAELVALGILAGMSLSGGLLVWWKVELPKQAEATAIAPSLWNRQISGRWLALVLVLGGAAVCARLLYVYYPEPQEIYAEMAQLRPELVYAVRHGRQTDESLDVLRRFRDLTGKLPVSIVLRQGTLDRNARERIMDLIYSLDIVQECLTDGRQEEAELLLRYVQESYFAVRQESEEHP